jgi:Holliday junction DNA helicase RuvB
LTGPPGVGKTSVAHALAGEMGVALVRLQGDGLGLDALCEALGGLAPGGILLLDELHALGRHAAEVLYSAMEDRVLLARGEARALPPWTCLATTTRAGAVPAPLRARYAHVLALGLLSPAELAPVVRRAAAASGVALDAAAVAEVARRCRGTPREAVRLVAWLADAARVHGSAPGAVVTRAAVDAALRAIGVDEHGLDGPSRAYLRVLAERLGGGPAGLRALAAALGVEERTVADVIEPYLLAAGWVRLSPRGRVLGRG